MPRGTGLLGSPPDETLDRLTALAGTVFKAPIAMLTLLDDTHLHAKSCVGSRDLAKSGRTPVKETFCQHVVRTAAPLMVRDAREDELTRGLAVVKSGKALAYLGVPLALAGGFVVGTLCVADVKPRAWTRQDIGVLEDLVQWVLTEIGRRADADARKQAESELQRTTDRLRGVLDHSPALIFAKDLEGRYLSVNRAGERLLGVPQDDAIGKLDGQLHPPALADALRAHDEAVIAAGEPLEVEETLELDHGTVHLRSVKFPLTDEAGEPYGICAICTEVSAQPAAERASAVDLGLGLGELSSAKTLLRRLETAVDAAQSALSTARPR